MVPLTLFAVRQLEETPVRRRKSEMRLSVLTSVDGSGTILMCIWSPSDWNEVSVSWGQGPLLFVQVPGVLRTLNQ